MNTDIHLRVHVAKEGQRIVMKDDAISRQAAIGAIRNMCEECDSSYCGECRVSFPGRRDCEKVLEELPSTQPEIVHCEFCKHWKNNHLCECLSRYGTFDTPKDFFCGYGKAK